MRKSQLGGPSTDRITEVQIRQGKNLLGIQYDVDLSDVVTRIMPTGADRDGNVLYLPELFLDSPLLSSYPHPKWIHMDVSDAKEVASGSEARTKDECYTLLREKAQEQFDAGCDLPNVSVSVDFLNCAKTEEYKEYGLLQNIFLGDAVRVVAPRITGTTLIVKPTHNIWLANPLPSGCASRFPLPANTARAGNPPAA